MHDINHRALPIQGTTLAAGAAVGRGAPPPAAGLVRPASGDLAALDAVLGQAVSNGAGLGVAAMGATPDGVVYDGAFGTANVETGAPMRDDTVFWLLSMTKAFTATAAMQLIEQGRMRLDHPGAEILPQLAKPQVLEGFDTSGRPILRLAKR